MGKFISALKSGFEKFLHPRIRSGFFQALPYWVGALLTGLLAIGYARVFSAAELIGAKVYEVNRWYLLLLTPFCFILSWAIVHFFAPFARGSGIPQVSAAIEWVSDNKPKSALRKLLGLRILVIKILSSLVLIAGGGSIGREGPTIQLAASVFKKIQDWLPSGYPVISRKNMLVTGAASGLAAAFNTPLGGIVFAIEELTKTHFNHFKSALLTGVILAGLTALSISGPYLYLGYPVLQDFPVSVIWLLIPLALVIGILSAAMANLILRIFRWKRSFSKTYHHLLFAGISGLALAAVAIGSGHQVMGSGKEQMVNTLFETDPALSWLTPVQRLIGPVISFTSGGAGGIFAPALSCGASIAAFIADQFHFSGSSLHLITLCGMAAFLTGITRSPFTSAILILEMTDSHNVIFYLLLSSLTANLIAGAMGRKSFYDQLKDAYIKELDSEREITAGSA